MNLLSCCFNWLEPSYKWSLIRFEPVFCLLVKQVSTGLMSVATQKELQELNISLLLNPASWIEGMNDEADFDVLNLNE